MAVWGPFGPLPAQTGQNGRPAWHMSSAPASPLEEPRGSFGALRVVPVVAGAWLAARAPLGSLGGGVFWSQATFYRAFLGRPNGPRAGWLLASLDPTFVVGRARDAAAMASAGTAS